MAGADPPRPDLLQRVGARVRALRHQRGWTLKELAAAAGLSVRFVSQLEGGQANIAIGRLDAVARALGADLAALVAEPTPPGDPRAELLRLLDGRTPDELRRCLRSLRLLLGVNGDAGAPRPRIVALLGLRGAGKSSLGAAAAAALGLPFVELDDDVERAAGLSLAELFGLHGEPYYRRLVGQCLAERIMGDEPCLVALPGGVVHDAEAFALLRDHATTVWLRADPADHMHRVLAQGDRRPLAMAQSSDAMAELRSILAAREPLYRQADETVDTSAAGEGALDALLEALERRGWSSHGAPA